MTLDGRKASSTWRANRTWKTISLLPFIEALAIQVLSMTYFSPMFAKPPDWLGIPFGLVLEVLLLGWAALGAAVIWTTRSPAKATIALVVTSGPASVLQLFIPALIPQMTHNLPV